MKTNLTAGLSALCAILLIVLLVLQAKQKTNLETLRLEHQAFATATEQRQQESREAVSKLADQMATLGTNLESRLVQGEQQANEKMGATLNMVQQNTAVMHRALGKVIPVELPEALTNQLAALEARIADENSWPKDSTNTDVMVAELRGLIRQIPPWAEEDYLPQLNALRWAVQSLELIQANVNAQGEDLNAAADAYANQLSIQPDGGAANIAAALTSRQQVATARFAAFRRDIAINDAKEQLGLAVMTDGLGAWQHLAEWTNDPAVGSNALELRQQLHARLLDDGIANFIESSRDNVKRLSVVTNSVLRQAGYARLFDSVTEQRLNVLQQPGVSQETRSKLEIFFKSVENKLKEEADKQNLGYQQWALKKISDFRRAFDTAMSRSKPGALYGRNPDPDFQGVDDAMVRYLAPISPGYLDASVANLFNQAFNDGWNKLGSNLQVDVAEHDVKILKRTPQNYQEEQ